MSASQTIATYNRSATSFADHFQSYGGGPVNEEIARAFELAGNPKEARVVEVGCGAGKDAAAIVPRCAFYEGFDPAAELLVLARQHVPKASFLEGDALSYEYPENLHIVFAFASMLHLDRDEFRNTCRKVEKALVRGGIFCLTLKEATVYKSELQTDKFGERTFYFYNAALVAELAGGNFVTVYESHDLVGPKHKPWLTIILRKP